MRVQPVLAVGDLVRPRRRAHERVDAKRREVVLPILDDRGKVLHAQLRGLFIAPARCGLYCAADELNGVGEVDWRQDARHRALGGLVDVHEVLEHRRPDVKDLFDVARLSFSAVVIA